MMNTHNNARRKAGMVVLLVVVCLGHLATGDNTCQKVCTPGNVVGYVTSDCCKDNSDNAGGQCWRYFPYIGQPWYCYSASCQAHLIGCAPAVPCTGGATTPCTQVIGGVDSQPQCTVSANVCTWNDTDYMAVPAPSVSDDTVWE